MSISGLRKTGEKYAKRYFRLTILSVAVAAVFTAVVGAAGNPTRLSVLPGQLAVPPTVAVFFQTFVLCFALGLVGRLLVRNLETLRELFAEWIGNPLRDRWRRLARRTQAVLFGLWWMLVVGGLAAAAVVYYSYPRFVIAAVMVCTWPLSTYWLLGRRPSAPLASTDADSGAVRRRYAALRHLETRSIAALFGFLLAAGVATGLWLLGVEVLSTIGLGALVWLVSTVVVYNRYASVLELRSDLSILSVDSDDEVLELVVRNTGLDSVDLTDATITDTRTERYHLSEPLELSSASSATLTVPASFAVSPTDAERTLPLGYTLNRSQPTPVVYTQSGAAFELARESTADEPFESPASTYSASSTAIGAGTHSHES